MIPIDTDMTQWTREKIALWENYLNENPNSKIADRVRRGLAILKDLV